MLLRIALDTAADKEHDMTRGVQTRIPCEVCDGEADRLKKALDFPGVV